LSTTQDVKNPSILWEEVPGKRGRNHIGDQKC